MDKLKNVKLVANFVVGAGTYKIVKETIKANVETETLVSKITVTAASIVIASMATDKTTAYVDQTINKLNEAKAELKKNNQK